MNKQDVYRQIQREYETIRYNNDLAVENRKKELYSKFPQIKSIDDRLKELGISLTKLALRHAAASELDAVKSEVKILNEKKAALLSAAGLDKALFEPMYTCAVCKDTGYIGTKKCACLKKKLIAKYYKISNLDTILQYENFEHFNLAYYSESPHPNEELTPRENMQEILEDVLSHTELSVNGSFNYYFYGNSGLGKTFMCSCIAKKLLDSAYSVIYMTAYALASLLEKNRFRYDDIGETDEAVEMLFDSDLLIIDDLGTESPNSVTASEIFNVINSRLIKQRSTVISSNLEPSELATLYSDRVVSRIIGNYTLHHFYGSDIRMK
jgi:DNA replication protein DnaC